MKNAKLKFMALMLVVVMALTGCMTEDLTLKINSDGSGVCDITEVVDEEAMMDNAIKLYKVMGMPAADIDLIKGELKQSFKEIYLDQGFKSVSIDGKQCYQLTEHKNIKKGQLSKEVMQGGQGYITTDTFYLKLNLSSMMEESLMSLLGEDMSRQEFELMLKTAGIDLNSAVTFKISVEFPKAIVSTNGTIDTANPNKVSFKGTAATNREIFATTNPKVTLDSARAKYKADNTIKQPKIKKLKANKVSKKAKKATVTLKISKVSGAKKYQVQYSTKSSFKGAKTKTIKKTTYKITKLKKKKKYYVRVRAVKYNLSGEVVNSKWTKKSVKTKK